jgi:hypothetical protein
MTALDEIAAERRRQIDAEGWTPEHDDEHSDRELAAAAAAYAYAAGVDDQERDVFIGGRIVPRRWPWSLDWWKPSTRRRDLIKAAALIVAEIERLDRAAQEAGDAG